MIVYHDLDSYFSWIVFWWFRTIVSPCINDYGVIPPFSSTHWCGDVPKSCSSFIWFISYDVLNNDKGKINKLEQTHGSMNICAIILSVQIADDEGFPQNHTFAHAHIYNISCLPRFYVLSSKSTGLLSIFPSFLPLVPWCRTFPTTYPILNQHMRYYVIFSSIILHHYRMIYIYLPPRQTIRIKAL